MTIDRLKKEFPNISITPLNGGAGCNVHLPKKLTLTFWFKKLKWKSNEDRNWRSFADNKDVIHLISTFGNLKLKSTPVEPVIASVNKVQLCIDHVNEKARRMCEIKGITNGTVMMLQTVALELEQYL